MPVEEFCEDLGRSLWKPVDEVMSEPTLAQVPPLCCRITPASFVLEERRRWTQTTHSVAFKDGEPAANGAKPIAGQNV
jgi:hypothetical protein